MLEKSLGLLFFLKRTQDHQGNILPIYLRITVDGVPKEMSVKRFWDLSRWNVRASRATGNREDARGLNDYLDVLQNNAYAARTQLIDRGKIVTAIAIRDMLSGETQRKRLLMVLFKSHNEDLKNMIGKGVEKGTWTNYNTSYKHTLAFLKSMYKTEEINILSLDLEFVKKLYRWFRTTKNLNHNSSLKNIANMKKIVLDCVDNGWLINDPFAKFEMTREDVDTVYLSKEELQAIAHKEITNDRLSRVRDLFIFCSFTGLSFIDVKQLKRSEVTIASNGELRIFKNRQKTGTPAVIPLLPISKKILAKYQNDEFCKLRDMLLPAAINLIIAFTNSSFYCTGERLTIG
ncbi:site-specific integrase [Mucilaginibacter sabulilitoris]|uniref:Site-specific integrase n=1 Tax=Mucilaginibacter sabulilitoris TaxID=1173583 RepID=A0ABZ0THS4_9SPHI|nr:site-specific integrase [Mucilaginibacter sabulilitoris]WPU92502.1 site-specific integrase [Mucilaginibacter sabulilitoris]